MRFPQISILFLALGSSVVFTLPGFSADSDETTLRKQAEDYAKAFSAGDFQAVANCWATDGTFTDADGNRYSGRESIARYFKEILSGSMHPSLQVTIDKIRQLNDSVAVEEGTTVADNLSEQNYLAVHVKRDGQWVMLDVMETNSNAKAKLSDLSWLIGDWKAEGKDNLMEVKVKELESKFLSVSYLLNGKLVAEEKIGINPKNGLLSSWMFSANGGVGTAYWVREGKLWTKMAESYEVSGLKSGAVYNLKVLSPDSFVWNSSSRYIAGNRLADGKAVQMVRCAKGEGK